MAIKKCRGRPERWRGFVSFVLAIFALCEADSLRGTAPQSQEHREGEKRARGQNLVWDPPDVDAPLPSLSQNPACDLSNILVHAGASASELATNLERFTALERIVYKKFGRMGVPNEVDDGTFDYVFAFEEHDGGSVSQEYRSPTKGSYAFRSGEQDTGEAALALIFHPNMQTDYQMICEGLDKRNGQLAWVIHFQQREDKSGRTLCFPAPNGSYCARLKGRAWISAEDFHVIHLETHLMADIPAIKLESSAILIDYALVYNQSQKISLWLPERIEAYWEFANRRVILLHTYTDFKLFVVETEEKIQKPTEP